MANEIQRLYFGSQASPVASADLEDGTYRLRGFGSMEVTGDISYTASTTDIETALEGLDSVGDGDVSVTQESDGFTIEFQGALANTNIDELVGEVISLKAKADGITIQTTQNGVASTAEIQIITDGGATTGSIDINGNSTSANISAPFDVTGLQTAMDSIWGSSKTLVTEPSTGEFWVTWQAEFVGTDIAEMSFSNNTTDGSPGISTGTNGAAGQPQIVLITLDDSPTEGTLNFALDGNSTGDFAHNSDSNGFSLTGWTMGGSAGNWTATCDTNASDVSTSASEGSSPLRKSVGVEVVTVQEGSAGGGPAGTNLLLLGVG